MLLKELAHRDIKDKGLTDAEWQAQAQLAIADGIGELIEAINRNTKAIYNTGPVQALGTWSCICGEININAVYPNNCAKCGRKVQEPR